MKRHLFFLFCFTCILPLSASTTDSISTTYTNREFITYCQVLVNASDSISKQVTKDFDYQMRYDLGSLFGWALKGMNLRREYNETMMFYLKSTAFHKETNTISALGDVIVPGLITIPNIEVDSRLTSKKFSNGKSTVYIDLLSANGFITKMNCSFSVIPTKNKGVLYTLESHIKFGWFFNIFITQSRFKSLMEWRFKKFIHNLKNETERREKIFKQ